MTHERLILPPRAARLWPVLVKVSRRFFPHTKNQPGWTLGGGTVLAARWNRHRDSTDLDAKIQEIFTDEVRTSLASMFERGNRWFSPGQRLDRMMRRAGGRRLRISTRPAATRQADVNVEGPLDTKQDSAKACERDLSTM